MENYTMVCSYVYDSLGQLVRENNVEDNKTYVWNYDSLGNIESLLVYDYTTGAVSNPESGIDYQYTNDNKEGWNKLLTTLVYKEYIYNEAHPNGTPDVISTETVNYDKIGNPTNYQGATMSWFGRQMTSYSKGDVTATFTYDADGLRGSKTVNGAKTTYYYVGNKLYYQRTANADGSTNYELYFYYDSYNNLSAIRYINSSGDYYYYVTTNAQGDVLGLYDGDGVLHVSYEYDTWGNLIAARDANGNAITNTDSIAHRNPIRYRGYYYDTDLGLYYLQSRYYDATIGRFLNADGYITTDISDPLSYNMFAYCLNNPVNIVDPTGKFPWLAVIISVAVVAVTALDHYLAKNHPKGVSLTPKYNETWETNDYVAEAKTTYAKGSGASIDKNGATLFDTEIGLYKDETTYNNGDQCSMIKFLTAEASCEFDWSGIPSLELGGYAAVYSCDYEYTFDLGIITIRPNVELYYGSVSGSVSWDFDASNFSIAPPSLGAGFSVGVDIDWK